MFKKKKKCLKDGTKKVICTASKKIYTESIRKFHDQDNETVSDKISLLVFYGLKPFLLVKRKSKVIYGISCLNPHVLLNSSNGYRSSIKLTPYKSRTAYLKQIKTGEKFDETSAVKICKYYQYLKAWENVLSEKKESV